MRFCNYLFNSWTNILNYQRVTCWCLWEVFLYFTLFKILKSTNRKDSCHFVTIFQACKYQHVYHSKAKLLNFFWAFWKQLTSLSNLIILSYGSFMFFNDGLETVWQTVGFGIWSLLSDYWFLYLCFYYSSFFCLSCHLLMIWYRNLKMQVWTQTMWAFSHFI